MTDINEMKKRIIYLQSLIQQKQSKLNPKNGKGVNWEEIWNMQNEVTELKRKVFLHNEEEAAIPIPNTYPQCSGAPIPLVLSNGYKTLLLFYIGTSNPNWSKKANKIKILNENSKDYIALICFDLCRSFKYGGVNDEALHGHPLYDRGLVGYEMHEVKNSSWISELKKMNSVHDCYDEKHWASAKHIIFTFHDDIFECVADNYSVQVYKGNQSEVYKIACELLTISERISLSND